MPDHHRELASRGTEVVADALRQLCERRLAREVLGAQVVDAFGTDVREAGVDQARPAVPRLAYVPGEDSDGDDAVGGVAAGGLGVDGDEVVARTKPCERYPGLAGRNP